MKRNNGDIATTEHFIKQVQRGNNVKAKDKLEEILKRKVARRIKDTLAQ